MGFSNCIVKYPIYKNTTLEQVYAIRDYCVYDTNEWAKNNFASAEEFMLRDTSREEGFTAPTKSQIEFYKKYLHKDEFGIDTITDYVYSACSNGAEFHRDIQTVLHKDPDTSLPLSQDQIIKLLQFEIQKFEDYKLYPASINYSYVNSKEDEEEEYIILKKCDGVEVLFEDGTGKRIATSSDNAEYGTVLMMPKGYVDEFEYTAYFNLIKDLSNILATTDFEKEALVYSGGW